MERILYNYDITFLRHPNNGLRSLYHQRLPPPPHPLNIPPNLQRFPARLPQRQPGPPDSYSYERAPFPHDIHHSAPEILQKPIVDTEGPFEGPQSLQHHSQPSGSHTENQAYNQDERYRKYILIILIWYSMVV